MGNGREGKDAKAQAQVAKMKADSTELIAFREKWKLKELKKKAKEEIAQLMGGLEAECKTSQAKEISTQAEDQTIQAEQAARTKKQTTQDKERAC